MLAEWTGTIIDREQLINYSASVINFFFSSPYNSHNEQTSAASRNPCELIDVRTVLSSSRERCEELNESEKIINLHNKWALECNLDFATVINEKVQISSQT